jgi:hypothetical protein
MVGPSLAFTPGSYAPFMEMRPRAHCDPISPDTYQPTSREPGEMSDAMKERGLRSS